MNENVTIYVREDLRKEFLEYTQIERIDIIRILQGLPVSHSEHSLKRKAIEGNEPAWRIHLGIYRIIYEFNEFNGELIVIHVGKRVDIGKSYEIRSGSNDDING